MSHSATRTNWFLLSAAILLFLLAAPLLWAAAGLPGVTGGSGSELERTMLFSWGASSLWMAATLISLSRQHWHAAASFFAGFGFCLLFSMASTFELAKEVGMRVG